MPSKSPAQARMMAAVAHNPSFARKVGIPQSVGQEFNKADAAMNKGYSGSTQKFAQGGPVLGKESSFMKTTDEFRDPDEGDAGADEDNKYGKDGAGKGSGFIKPPAAKGKSLSAVKPKK